MGSQTPVRRGAGRDAGEEGGPFFAHGNKQIYGKAGQHG